MLVRRALPGRAARGRRDRRGSSPGQERVEGQQPGAGESGGAAAGLKRESHVSDQR